MARVAVLGVGAMGSRMAMALIRADHRVTVWNRSPEPVQAMVAMGAVAAQTPRHAATQSEFVISMVRDDEASRRVWLHPTTGALAGCSDAIAIESSTLSLAWVKELSLACEKKKVRFIDAPVAGSRAQAEAAKLIYLVGGEPYALSLAEPILRAMGTSVCHAGPVGSGAAVKLAVNALLAIQVAAIAELFGFLRGAGVDESLALEIISATPVCSQATKAAAAAMIAGNFAPAFPIELVEKDLSYLLLGAQQAKPMLPLSHRAQRLFDEALRQGFGAENLSAVAKLY